MLGFLGEFCAMNFLNRLMLSVDVNDHAIVYRATTPGTLRLKAQ